MTGPRSADVSGWPGAPGAGSGGDQGPAAPVKSGVVGNNDFLEGGAGDGIVGQAFPGYGGDTWQGYQSGAEVNVSTVNDTPGYVSDGIRVSSPAAFYPGLGQGV